ncbi:MAG TPA: hypothetical protein VMA32_05445 [Streptosporangiaceae bacterium]|nr:hypothetical protein [Streptosporangiaceae bacterium]
MTRNRIVAAVAGLALATGGVLAAAAPAAYAARAAVQSAQTTPRVGPVPAGFKVASVTFVSASEGWVLGTTKTCAHAPCTSVLWTTNGGATWAGIPAPVYKLAKYDFAAGLQRLRFADPSDGFAYGSQLWATHNGGSAWHRVRQVPGYITDLEASAGRVYAVSTSGSSARQVVYASPAGTDSWHRVTGLPVTKGYGGLGTITLHGTAAWIILQNRLYSTKTGSHWVRDSFKCPGSFGIASVGAYSAQKITLLCVGNAGLGSTQKVLYASSDGGAHFRKVGTPPAGGDGGLLAEPTPRHLFIATASGATWLYASTNAGRSWRTNFTRDDGGKGWNDFGFTTATQGVAVEGTPTIGSTLWMTTNAGRSWHKVKF